MDNSEKINISEIADYVSQALKEHVIFHDKSEADALTAWIVLTYFIEQMDIFPFVLITSPEPQCGKSTALRMLSAFVKNPQSASRITPAAIHRVIERDQPTLLLDEADRFVLNNQELIGILNAGHARFDAHVIINQKQNDGNWEPAEFSVWCAKAIAGIEVKDDTITSRSLVIRLRRKLISEPITRYTYKYPLMQQSIREQIEAWAANIQLSNMVEELEKEIILKDVTEGLTISQSEKVRSLSEGLEYTNQEDMMNKITLIKDNYFPSDTIVESVVLSESATTTSVEDSPVVQEENKTQSIMDVYARALSKPKD